MLTAINNLTIVEFVLAVLAVGCTLIQLALLAAVATHATYTRVHWGIAAVALWITFFVVTR